VVETAPKITAPLTEFRVKKGEDVDLRVDFTATPQPTDEWTVNGKVIKKTKKFAPTLDESSASLTIFKVEDSDVGTYNIRLRNNCGEASADLKVVIMGKLNCSIFLFISSYFSLAPIRTTVLRYSYSHNLYLLTH